jgi:xanthine dehydrogenase small subunit
MHRVLGDLSIDSEGLMLGLISHRALLQPKSLNDALGMLRDEGPLVPMAGCTDLYVSLNFGTLTDTRFLNLWRLDALRTIEVRDNLLSIGALATHTDLIRAPLVRRRLPMLAAAAREVGGVQIQNRGTLGGNVANASPAGDTLPVLAAADATIVLQSAEGTRRVPFTEFYIGYRQTLRRPDELIVAFEIPAIRGRQWFRKVGTRAAQAISKVVMAGVVPAAGSGRSTRSRQAAGDSVRIAVGSVAPTVVRAFRTEAVLAAGGSIEAAQQTLLDELAPIDDIRSTALYRRRVAANLLARMLTALREA